MSAAKIFALIYAVLGIILAPFFLLAGAFSMVAGRPGAGFGNLVFALFAPLIYGLIGFIGGALLAWLYNLGAGWMGGVELEFQPLAPPLAPTAPVIPAGPIQPA